LNRVDHWDVLWRRTIEIPGFSFFHDMAITRKHALFVQGSFDFNPLPFVLGFKVRGDRSCRQ
jgi:all-trans-8'-apo-beta-carotenal 15,15'-oxygenase